MNRKSIELKSRKMFAVTLAVITVLVVGCTQAGSPTEEPIVASSNDIATDVSTDVSSDAKAEATDEHDHDVAATDTAGLAGHIGEDGRPVLVELPAGDQPQLLVNVWFDENGVWPQEVSVPTGRRIQLVMRNHDVEEHHYHILGLPTVGMLWLEKSGEMTETDEMDDAAAAEHEDHHADGGFVPFHVCTSESGVCPTGQWIHGHADPSDVDMIVFVTEEPGRYQVTDPLHPEMSAWVNVFETAGA